MKLTGEQINLIMDQAQVFASAWSLVGGPFDFGNALETAEEETQYRTGTAPMLNPRMSRSR
jgi:ADP-ribose pyrophosphatase YjhB (NUDIX family)